MSTNSTIHPNKPDNTHVWYDLHSEREQVCESLIPLRFKPYSRLKPVTANEKVLQARLRLLDDALDRFLSGAYGYCASCGKRIDDEKLRSDIATVSCGECG